MLNNIFNNCWHYLYIVISNDGVKNFPVSGMKNKMINSFSLYIYYIHTIYNNSKQYYKHDLVYKLRTL